MNSQKKLDEILDELNFTPTEKEGFNEAVQIAKSYMLSGTVDLEKQFQSIVERVSKDEV